MDAGCLYVVATPIGNLEDITARAVRILSEVHVIAAEDTRHSRRLLDHFGILTPVRSYHEHNEAVRTEEFVAALAEGKNIALITDAGTPCISDPGYRIVHEARKAGFPVAAIPGPCAVTAALSVSGLPTDAFTFHGFFPRKPGDANRLMDKMTEWSTTHIFYESPNRLTATLGRLADAFPDAPVVVARELTKKFEEVVSGTAGSVQEHFNHARPRGECVVLIHTESADPGASLDDEAIRAQVADLMASENLSQRDAIRRVSQMLHVPRNRVYAAATRSPWNR